MLQSLDNGTMVLAKLLIAGRLVLGDRHFAEENLDFRQHALGDRLMSDGERGGMRRMAMDDAR